jgi:PAS domain S-box-containing protein
MTGLSPDATTWLILAAAALQLAAAGVALTLITVRERGLPWLLVGLGLILLAAHGLLVLPSSRTGAGVWGTGDALAEGVVLAASAVLLAAMLAARRVLISTQSEALRASDELRRASATEERDELLFSHGPVVRMRWVAPRTVSSASENVRRWGFEPESLTALGSFDDLIHPEDRERVSAEANRAKESGQDSWSQAYRLRTPDGKDIWVFDVTVAERDADGEVVRYDGYLVDISKQKAVELAMQRTDAILRAVSSTADRFLQDPRWQDGGADALGRLGEATSASRVYVFENHKEPGVGLIANKLYEWTAEGAPARADQPELRSIPYGRAGLERWARTLASGGVVSGDVREFSASERAVLEVQGALSVVLVPIFDRARSWTPAELEALRVAAHTMGAAILRERVEDQLRQAHKIEAVGQLAGGIAHDFNNLLMAMLGAAELLRRRLPPDPELHEPLEIVQRTAERAADLTQRLLAFSRRQRLQPRLLDPNRTVSELLPTLRRVIPENISVDFVPAHEAGSVRADQSQLEQVIMNLCINACDAMSAGGTITIEVENVFVNGAYVASHPWAREGRYVLLTVTDTGTGMEPPVLEKVFEPFFTTKPPGKGTGLGLASVYGIVKQHDGMVHAYSEPGHGTAMKVYLPLVERPASEVGAKIAGTVRGGREKVLVVEDENEVRNVLRGALADLGYRVLAAGDGMEAMDVLEDEGFAVDLIITDLVMPRMGGQELFARVRERAPATTFLFSSGYSETALLADIGSRERVHFIAKPYGLDALARKVRSLLDGAA